ncbi:Stk1 family PASTA domain-containing Ser/Thr kinase [Isoptericola sp. b441]|uniref:non-specific serine/threonine protein kinase n=1 Tax=Actinotalea lenta TaxID=3064654 RepID=A0ABT9D5T3_9CELL|nr:Stk1 family PASTA domain-containing Ser/Thr kinase [Isoptericola sp. b441]MDO8106162.1 Stk1 family PASTA domain-containing Ser/Thr kinase [Isoptericola sp. b441]
MDDAPRILGGRYEVGELIGRGGMAEVHIGHDTRLGRTVAIKILRSDLARDPSFQARFRREAQAAASLNHPAVVAVYDTGEDVVNEAGGGIAHVPFIVMEYVEGHTVRDILRDGAAVPIDEAVEITAGVLSALEYSHRAGIVHRDIKPANVMLTPTGAVKVMDFGIARAMADSAGTMTQTQAVIGTAQYLSPEQARGEAVDSRSDLYSTGCLLFELLTGRPPFIGDSPVAVAYQHAREDPQPPSTYASDVPETLDRITLKALAKDRDQRYRSASEFRNDLESVLRGGPVSAPAVMPAPVPGTMPDAGPPTAATQVMTPPPVGPAPTSLPPTAAWGPTGATVTAAHVPARDDNPPDRRWVMWLLIAVALLAIGGILWILLSGRPPATTTASVPDVVGLAQADAEAKIREVGLVPEITQQANLDVEKGFVIKTDPEKDTKVEDGSTVKVFVSSGAADVEITDMSNWSQAQAEKWLKDNGFNGYKFTEEDSPDVPKDKVTRTDPAAGDSVNPTSTEVTVYLSNGQVTVDDFRDGKTPLDVATKKLEDLGLTVQTVEQETDQVDPGIVVDQSVVGKVDQHSTVELTYAVPPAQTDTTVPDTSGMTYSEAAAALGGANLNATPGPDEFSDTVPAGQVIRTDPAAGTTVKEGSTVTVISSKGPKPGGSTSSPTATSGSGG